MTYSISPTCELNWTKAELIFEEGSEEPTGYLGPDDEIYRELTEDELENLQEEEEDIILISPSGKYALL